MKLEEIKHPVPAADEILVKLFASGISSVDWVIHNGGKEGEILVSVNVDFPFNDEIIEALTRKNAKGELAPNQPREDWLQEMAQLINMGLPTVQYIAAQLHLSPKYLSGLLRVSTGQNTQQHIHDKLIEKAKGKVSIANLPVSEIAYELGSEHLQSFSRVAKFHN